MLMLECTSCKEVKESSLFYKSKGKAEFESSCKDCRNLSRYNRRVKKRIIEGLPTRTSTRMSRELLGQHKKFCPRCLEIKDINGFSKSGDGIATHCKECNKEMLLVYYKTDKGKKQKEESYKRNKNKLKNNKLIRQFGITLDEYEAILESQNYKCIICGKTDLENKKMLAVDHCHETGKNRELLCSSCNICIGFIEKNKLDINIIINYLNKHKSVLPTNTKSIQG